MPEDRPDDIAAFHSTITVLGVLLVALFGGLAASGIAPGVLTALAVILGFGIFFDALNGIHSNR